MLAVLFLVLALAQGFGGGKGNGKSLDIGGRMLSLFNTVKFKNEPCTGQGNQTGLCLSSTDCAAAQGFSVGGCASGRIWGPS